MKRVFSKILPSVGILAMLAASPAQAQDAADADEEIIVTGTQIRGVQATGSQSVTLSQEDIVEQGAFSTNEVLAAIPQIGQFNGRFEGEPRGAERGITINRPNLRNLPGFNSASGSVTLILMDGHHLAPLGINESAIDPDVVPAAVLERVEVVTDGGSSVYGADAVSGVINFITKREFDGVQVDANYGLGDTIDGFSQWDAAITAGTSWNRGNGYISIGTSDREGITNGETNWSRMGVWQPDDTLAPIGTECRAPVGTEKRWFWVDFISIWTDNPLAPGAGVFPLGSPCDQFAESTYLPEQQRDNLFGSLTQEISDNMTLHVTGYYTQRTTDFVGYPQGYTTEAVDEPPPIPPPGTPLGTIGVVPLGIGFSFGPHPAYVNRAQTIEFETWGITPELTIDIGHDWQLRNMLFYGGSNNSQNIPRVNAALAQDYVDADLLDPFNVAAADASVIQDIVNWEEAHETNQDIIDFRTIADGPVLELPAGAMRAAVGFEYTQTNAEAREITGTIGSIGGLSFEDADRDVYSVFGELSIPVIDALDLSVSARYDNYSDFGSTTNPTIGFDLHPVSWFSVFGHWGTSFNAPTVVDQFAIATGVVNADNGVPVLAGIDIFNEWDGGGDDVFQATGSASRLDPQTSEQWELGFNASPIDGLSLHMTYYEIDFADILGATNPLDPRSIAANEDKYIWNPTQVELDNFIAGLDNAAELQARNLQASDFAFILDRITDNVDSAKLQGYDFGVDYTRDTDIGTFDVGFSGNHQTKFTVAGADFLAFNVSDLAIRGYLGWRGDHLSTRVTLNYTGGFDTDTAQNGQTSVESFTTTDLFVGYNFADAGERGTSLRFSVDNVTEEEPPLWRQNAQNLAYSGFTLGRVFKVGLSTAF